MSQHESEQQRANLVRPEHADQNVPIDGESQAFAPDSPESIPKLHVPGLSPDATSVPPEALRGDVPTLTDPFIPEVAPTPPLPQADLSAPAAQETAADASREVALVPEQPHDPDLDEASDLEDLQADANEQEAQQEQAEALEAQEPEAEADTWTAQMQVRIEKLTDEISQLNDRLDRFEKLPKV